jgi:hypothetical protein
MIKITLCETVYPAPEEEEDYCPDGIGTTEDQEVTFRELVSLLRDYRNPSCSRATGSTNEWLSAEPEQDYRTGEWTERSLHYRRDNHGRSAKYWRKAMIHAGLIRSL